MQHCPQFFLFTCYALFHQYRYLLMFFHSFFYLKMSEFMDTYTESWYISFRHWSFSVFLMFPLILLWDFSIYCLSICKRGSPGFQVNNDVHEIITFYFLRKTPSSIDKNELTKKLPGSCREIICFVIRDSTPVLAREMKCDIQSVKRDTPSI